MATINGTSGNDTLTGTSDDDTITSLDGNDSVDGGSGNDRLDGGGGDDSVSGGDGNDDIIGRGGNDRLEGGSGVDAANYSAMAVSLVINLATGIVSKAGGGTDTLSGFENPGGGTLNDTVIGDDGPNILWGMGGDDSLDGGAGLDYAWWGNSPLGVNASLVTNSSSGDGADLLSHIEGLWGSPFGDTLTGASANDSLIGDNGSDRLSGGAGDDDLRGGAGDDTLDAGLGNDTVDGLSGNDSVVVPLARAAYAVSVAGAVTTLSASGSVVRLSAIDVVQFSDASVPIATVQADGGQTITGSSGNDARSGAAGADSIDGLAGNDTLRGLAGNDTLIGGAGNDSLEGGDGNDSLLGGTGADSLAPGNGNDTLDGGLVTDRSAYSDLNMYVAPAGGVVIDLRGVSGDGSEGFGTVSKGTSGVNGTDHVVNLNWLIGNSGDDRFFGSAARIFEQFNPVSGSDTIDGGAIEPTLFPVNGNRLSLTDVPGPVTIDLAAGTVLAGPWGDKTFSNISHLRGGSGDDLLLGSDQAVWVEWFEGNVGSDTIDGRGGWDALQFGAEGVATGVVVNLATGLISNDGQGFTDRVSNVEMVFGTGFADTLSGDAGPNRLDGGAGNDLLAGGAGDDSLNGGSGTDTVSYTTATGAVSVNLQQGVASGAAGTDSISSAEAAEGGAFDDTIAGSDGNNALRGGAGHDSLSGGAGNDTLDGGPGNDTLDGGVVTDRHYFRDGNSASYADAAAGIVADMSGVTGEGNSGSGTVQDGDGGIDTLRFIRVIVGSAHADRITGSAALWTEQFEGGPGDDTIDGGALETVLDRGNNRAVYANADAAVRVDLAGGSATGGDGTDVLINIVGATGSRHDDTLLGSNREDFSEQFGPGPGNDSIDGRGGFDFVRFDIHPAGDGAQVNLQTQRAGDGTGGTDTIAGIEGVFGSSVRDTLIGSDRSDVTEVFFGMAGSDSIDGAGGKDEVRYTFATEAVNVTLPGLGSSTASDGQGGTDTLLRVEAVRGSPFGDTLTGSDAVGETIEGYGGNDTIDGRGTAGSPGDTASYSRSYDSGAVVDLALGAASNDGWGNSDVLLNIEHVTGTLLYGDVLGGDAQANQLDGLGGNDTLAGLSGNDTLLPGTGVDNVDGGGGLDRLVLVAARSSYTLTELGAGAFRLVNSAADEDVSFSGIEEILFGLDGIMGLGQLVSGQAEPTPYADVLYGAFGEGADETIDALAGDDRLAGLGGNDSLLGGDGDDTLGGGDLEGGTIEGGPGIDTLDGGNGLDTAVLDGHFADYTVTLLSAGETRLVSALWQSNVTVRNVERLSFFDGQRSLAFVRTGTNAASELADVLVGTAADDAIDGLAGDDSISGLGGNDLLTGGPGNDTLDGGSGTDTASYAGTSADVQLDLLQGTAGGGAGTDLLIAIENATGGGGNDLLVGDGGRNSLDGGAGNDTLQGADGSDTLVGGAGNDLFRARRLLEDFDLADYGSSPGGVVVTMATTPGGNGTASDGFGGTDTIEAAAVQGILGSPFADAITGSPGQAGATDDGYFGHDELLGGAGNDTIRGLAGEDYLYGEGGDDSLAGGPGNDTLWGGAGADTLDGSGGVATAWFDGAPAGVLVNLTTQTALDGWGSTDTLIGIFRVEDSSHADTFIGSAGDDSFDLSGGNDSVDGRGGNDRVSYEQGGSGAAVVVNLATGLATGGSIGNDTLASIEWVDGSRFNDTLTGSAANESLNAAAGQDSLDGGAGNDTLEGGAGGDVIRGGSGTDWAVYRNATAAVTLNLATQNASGGDGGDSLIGIEALIGSTFGDSISGDSADNTLHGGAGNDTLGGGGGNDLVDGGEGFDLLRGGAGNDTLDGGLVTDRALYNDANTASYSEEGAAVVVDLSGLGGDGSTGSGTATDGSGGTDTLRNIVTVVGSSHADSLTGSSARTFEAFEGGPGNDTIDGGTAPFFAYGAFNNRAQFVNAGAGVLVDLADSIASGDGNDRLVNINVIRASAHPDTLRGSDRSDTHEQFEGRSGADFIDGRGGIDLVRFDGGSTGVVASLVSGRASNDGYGFEDQFINVEGLRGGDFGDLLIGGLAANGTTAIGDPRTDGLERFVGHLGNDTLDGGQGFDRAEFYSLASAVVAVFLDNGSGTADDGSGGTDTLIAIEGLVGSALGDHFTGSNRPYERYEGRDGADTIMAGGGIDELDFSSDELQGANVNLASGVVTDGFGASDSVSGIEWVRGTLGFGDTITGNALDNRLDGQGGNDALLGGAGNDTLLPGNGSDTVDGGDGTDLLWLEGERAAYVVTPLAANQARFVHSSGHVVSASNMEAVRFADVELPFAQFTDTGTGGPGNDTLTGGGGADRLDGAGGDDSLRGEGGDDTLLGSGGSDTMRGGAGADVLEGGAGGDTLDGGDGDDFATYWTSPAAVSVDMAAGTASDGWGSTDTLLSITSITDSDFDDTLVGDAGDNLFFVRGGNDRVDGGGDLDVVAYWAATGPISVDLAAGTASGSGIGNDTLSSIEVVLGGESGDLLRGTPGPDRLAGNGGNDSLVGLEGNDTLTGGPGADTVDGGDGVDWIGYSFAFAPVIATLGLETLADGDGDDSVFSIEGLLGGPLGDRLTGGLADYNHLDGGPGNDTLDGGERTTVPGGYNVDVVHYRSSPGALTLDLNAGSAVQDGYTDTLLRFNAVFAGDGADNLRGLDGPPTQRGETLRGGGGNDTIDGGSGVDVAEFRGNRADYTVTQVNATTWTVRDNNPDTASGGDEGTDTLVNVERFVFADEMLSFGTRAEELARVACVLWSPGIITSRGLFTRGYSFYDNGGYSFEEMSLAALQFWTGLSNADLAAQLSANSGGTKTAEQFLATITAGGGNVFGRAAAVREAAMEPAITTFLDTSGVRVNGIVSLNFLSDFGALFELLPG